MRVNLVVELVSLIAQMNQIAYVTLVFRNVMDDWSQFVGTDYSVTPF